ncbi:quercetin dioxygenase-like cupin family protein [Rhodoligotrophos appendicifer]|uniref:DHCW motif cupin fold protein n=1 Tax=Rhodoligotrophos appendicifer TaxID=987056 RepID=UPI001180322E|nr:DHCW motif cupin fold protein [Rhodoligotrophos appendicifer]
MKLPAAPFEVSQWAEITAVQLAGETGEAQSREVSVADMRLRRVDYSPNYVADHWCDRGHVFFVLSGEIVVELRDGRSFSLPAGTSFHVSDHGDAAHRVLSRRGAEVFIVD